MISLGSLSPLFFVSTLFVIPAASAHGDGTPIVIEMQKERFSPSTLSIEQGETVIFKNFSGAPRWPASDIHPTHAIYPDFDPKQEVPAEEEWSFRFDKPGMWRFHDHLSPRQTGVINVQRVEKTEAPAEDSEVASRKPEGGFGLLWTRLIYWLLPSVRDGVLAQIDVRVLSDSEEDLHRAMQLFGPDALMEKLLADTGGGSLVDCHQEAHAVGRSAFEVIGVEAFRRGDPSCHSGFYHGAMESLLRERGTEDLPRVLGEACLHFDTSFERFECIHGVGHGAMAYLGNDLPEVLKLCQQLESAGDRGGCMGGAFMENIVVGQGQGASTDHQTDWLSADPHFPCNGIDQDGQIQFECYQMQTSWMLTLFGYNFEKAIGECEHAREDMIPVCYKSIGRDAAGQSLRNPEKMLATCSMVPKEKGYFDECVLGGLNVIVDFWGEKLESHATDFCKIIPGESKRNCYWNLALRLPDVFADADTRAAICNTFEEKYRYLCEKTERPT